MSKFGWSYPPGCNSVPGDEPDPPCEVCGNSPEDCICPECPNCGECGNPGCYKKTDPNYGSEVYCGGLYGKMTAAQKINKQKFVVANLELQWQDAQQYLEYLIGCESDPK